MVYFTCTHCGDAIQKPRVEKHAQFQCRNPISVTCMDCLKDFRGQEYAAHTKCVTENQRYGGKNYVAKVSSNKGERKQQEWIQAVHSLLSESTTLSAAERNVLNTLTKHENIPRKKAKFLNFAQSVLGGRASAHVVETIWPKMEAALENMNKANEDKSISNPVEQLKNNSVENEMTETLPKKTDDADLGKKEQKEKKSKTKKKRKSGVVGGEEDHENGEEKEEGCCSLPEEETAKRLGKRGRLDSEEVDPKKQIVAKKRAKGEVGNDASAIETVYQNGAKKKNSKNDKIADISVKVSSNIGERKQQEWIQAVHSLLSASTTLSAAERNVLNTLTKHENIPRKKAKFLNFAQSVLGGRASTHVVESIWPKMEAALENMTKANEDKRISNPVEQLKNNSVENEMTETLPKKTDDTDLGKKEQKEKKPKTKKKRKNGVVGGEEDHENEEEKEEGCRSLPEGGTAKRLGKRGRLDPEEVDPKNQLVAKKRAKGNNASAIETVYQNGAKKKNSKNHKIADISVETKQEIRNGVGNDIGVAEFDWKTNILEVVRSKGDVPLKKLRKMVVTDYQSHCKEAVDLEKVYSKFNKKINKITEIAVNGTRVSLR